MNKVLIVIGGPTAVGKTSLAIKVAKHFGAEILSADSRQFYREMTVGTAKPSNEELSAVKHHFINNLSIHDHYDVRQYEKEVLAKLKTLYLQMDVAVLVGGSGLFIRAVTDGMDDMPKVQPEIRQSLNDLYQQEGIEILQERLKKLDPSYFDIVDQKNPARLIRALEVIQSSNQAFSSFRTRKRAERAFDVIRVALDLERGELYNRIDQRMDQMIHNGLFEEASGLEDHAHLNSLQTVGYKEVFSHFNGEYDRIEAIRLLKRNSRRYAKRQLTWFRKDERYKWFDSPNSDEIIDYINSNITYSKSGRV